MRFRDAFLDGVEAGFCGADALDGGDGEAVHGADGGEASVGCHVTVKGLLKKKRQSCGLETSNKIFSKPSRDKQNFFFAKITYAVKNTWYSQKHIFWPCLKI